MGWFDEQIKLRKLSDNQVFEESFGNIADAVMGKRITNHYNNAVYTQDAMNQILKYYGYKSEELPKEIQDINEQLEFLCRPHGLMRRDIKLKKNFFKDAISPILAIDKKTKNLVALIPAFSFGYYYVEDGITYKVKKGDEDKFEEDAMCFYKSLPLRKITTIDLVSYAFSSINSNDIIFTLVLMSIVTLVGLLVPKINYFLMSYVVEEKTISLLLMTLSFLICINIGNLLFSTAKSLLDERINSKMSINVQAATMMRVLSLPANFFRKYSSGDLTTRVSYVSSLANTVMTTILSTGLSSLFSLAYIRSIFEFAPTLVIPSLAITILNVLASVLTTIYLSKITLSKMQLNSKENGMSYAMITGIQKIKLAGAEKRSFARWGNLYAKQVSLTYKPQYITLLSSIISYIGNIALYYIAIKSNISVADYFAFNSAYAMVSGGLSALASIVITIANIRPTLEMAKPILDAEPEIAEDKQVVTRIHGGIEFSNVRFRYDENSPLVVDDMSFKIKPGQYVAIVGKTGCGKSTLIRLLLGFEKAQKGAIYYDGKDINTLDLKSLRRKIGVVMQTGKLFMGDIFSNITISAPWLKLDDAWQAAEMAGIADDIKKMPMGMNTIISEGSGGISGGQRQRIMIARAIAPKPRVLIFDEATSALDNITQKKVSDALDSLKCTRIVVAHRLSTIKHCDRILYLEDGKILEDGTYDELIKLNGKFAQLVERQRLDK